MPVNIDVNVNIVVPVRRSVVVAIAIAIILEAVLHPQSPQSVLHLRFTHLLPPHQRGRGVDPEAVDPGLVSFLRLLRDQRGVDLEQDVLEGGAEVGAVDGGVAGGFRVVEVFTFGAVELDGLDVGVVRHAHGEERVVFAHDARTLAEIALLVFLQLVRAGSVSSLGPRRMETYHLR